MGTTGTGVRVDYSGGLVLPVVIQYGISIDLSSPVLKAEPEGKHA